MRPRPHPGDTQPAVRVSLRYLRSPPIVHRTEGIGAEDTGETVMLNDRGETAISPNNFKNRLIATKSVITTALFILFFGITVLGMVGMFTVLQWRPEVREYGSNMK